MTIRRLLITGIVAATVTPAMADGVREVLLDVEDNGARERWSVLLATPDAQAECAGIVAGASVAFAGIEDDPLPRRLKADRALFLENVLPARAAQRPATSTEFQDLLDRLEATAFSVGVLYERTRIAQIMGAEDAVGRLPLAWQLAQAGLTVEAALEALRLDKLASTSTPADQGASLIH